MEMVALVKKIYELKELMIASNTSKFDPMSRGAVFYDPKSGQIFLSTYEHVRRAADRVNEALRSDDLIF